MRKLVPDPAYRLEILYAVARVLLQPGCDREDVGIENDVFGREAGFLSEQLIGAPAHRGAPLKSVGLAFLVERHHYHRRAILAA